MKKAIVLLLALMLVGAVFAEDSKVTYTVSGDGWVKWGYNLDTSKHGFNNGYDLEADINLGTIAASKAGAEGDTVYGKVSLTGLDINLSVDAQDTAPAFDEPDTTISASVVAGPVTFGIYTAPGVNFNQAQMFSPWKDSDADWADPKYVRPAVTTAGGFTTTYTLGTLGSVYLKLASIGDWATATGDDKYAVAAGLTLTPVEKLLTITGGGLYDMKSKNAGVSGKVAVAAGDLAANAAIDVSLPNGADMLMDISGMVEYKLMEGKDKVGAYVYMLPQTVGTNLKQLNAKLMITDAGGFVDGLALTLGVYAIDVLDTAKIAVADSLSYTLKLDNGTVKPYQKLVFDVDGTNTMYLSLGVEAKVIKNTTITLDYTDGGTANKAYPNGMVTATDGIVSLKVLVAF
jgi:hypothetical protein